MGHVPCTPPPTLFPSVAILLYLARKYEAPDHWYPQDLQAQARVDEYLSWQHTALRMSCTRAMWQKVRPGAGSPPGMIKGPGSLLKLRTLDPRSPEMLQGNGLVSERGNRGTEPGNDTPKVSYQKHIYLFSCFRLC